MQILNPSNSMGLNLNRMRVHHVMNADSIDLNQKTDGPSEGKSSAHLRVRSAFAACYCFFMSLIVNCESIYRKLIDTSDMLWHIRVAHINFK